MDEQARQAIENVDNWKTLRIRDGDVVVFTATHKLQPNTQGVIIAEIQKMLRKAGHPEVPVIVVDGGATLGVLRREDAPQAGQ